MTGAAPLLGISGLTASYGKIEVLHGVDLTVDDGEAVVLLGANGAGKTTLMRAISNLVGRSDAIRIGGESSRRWPTSALVDHGIAHVPEGRGTFPDLSVHENLRIGAYRRRDGAVDADIDRWYEVFPVLAERRRQKAGLLSGGEQQMLAIARAMMSRPKLLMLDEPSLGLAPMIAAEVFRQLETVRSEQAMAMLVVEQNARLALSVADRGYVMSSGHVVASGTSEELDRSDEIRLAYLGR